jgi:hypothetical protein
VYNPQIWRELSQVGQQGISGAPSGFGNGGFSNPGGRGGSAGGPSKLAGALSDLAVVGGAFAGAESLNSPFGFLGIGGGSESEIGPIKIPIPFLGNLFCFIGCGHSNDEQPRLHPHETLKNYEIIGTSVISQKSAADFLVRSDDAPEPGIVLARYIAVPFSRLPEDVNQPPGNGFSPHEEGPNYVNSKSKQSLHPDPHHEGPKGPHWDLHSRNPKGKVSLRQLGDQLQYWAEDVQQWIEMEGPRLVPVE